MANIQKLPSAFGKAKKSSVVRDYASIRESEWCPSIRKQNGCMDSSETPPIGQRSYKNARMTACVYLC